MLTNDIGVLSEDEFNKPKTSRKKSQTQYIIAFGASDVNNKRFGKYPHAQTLNASKMNLS